jgi:Domain of unknown function (DUF1731)
VLLGNVLVILVLLLVVSCLQLFHALLLAYSHVSLVLWELSHGVSRGVLRVIRLSSHSIITSSSPSTLLYSTVSTGGQFVAPVKLSKAGFVFADTDLKDTISRILK